MDNYQNIILDGVEYGRGRRKHSKFFNEGKWNNFIAPLLPKDCSGLTFVEFGSNYGLYLKLAKQRGFKTVVGVEGNPNACEVAKRYVPEAKTIDVMLRNNIFKSGGWLNEIPAADYVLLSNFHYHIYLSVFLHFLNLLKRKTRYVIVVSADDAMNRIYMAKCYSDFVRKYFKEWKEIECIRDIPANGDPRPRKMFSMLFKSEIERVPIIDITNAFGSYGRRFYEKVKKDSKEQGLYFPMTHPILLSLPHRNVADGHHRLATLELEGETSALVEVI